LIEDRGFETIETMIHADNTGGATLGTGEAPLTDEKFGQRPDPAPPEEPIQGRIDLPSPSRPRHGQVCSKVARILDRRGEAHDLGHLLSDAHPAHIFHADRLSSGLGSDDEVTILDVPGDFRFIVARYFDRPISFDCPQNGHPALSSGRKSASLRHFLI
jgi:hypothetical protein